MTNTNRIINKIKEGYSKEGIYSDWLTLTQEINDKFSDATLDPDWMHINPELARDKGPYDNTIAFGFWTISMLTYFTREIQKSDYPEGISYGLNYGFDKLRLINPILVGNSIRLKVKLVDIIDKGNGRILLKTDNSIEIKGIEKPAMVCIWLTMYFTKNE